MQNVDFTAPSLRRSTEMYVTREGSRRQRWAPPFVLATQDAGDALTPGV